MFDGPFTPSELRRALTLCFDSAVGVDGLPYSVFKTNLPWWQSAVLHFFNLVLSWGVVPTPWKRSIVVPVFKRGDPSLPTNFRPISLASCCFKIFEHLVHARIGPQISPQLDECQGGFRWGADSLVGSLVDLLTSRSSSHTFVVFIDIHKAFDTSVEGTLVRLFDAGVSGQVEVDPNFSVALNRRCVLVPPSLTRGLTPELLKGVSFLLSCSISW